MSRHTPEATSMQAYRDLRKKVNALLADGLITKQERKDLVALAAKSAVKIRRGGAGKYEWVRLFDEAVIMDAEQGVLPHDRKAWLVSFYSFSPGVEGFCPSVEGLEVTNTLSAARPMAVEWAKTLVRTDDAGEARNPWARGPG